MSRVRRIWARPAHNRGCAILHTAVRYSMDLLKRVLGQWFVPNTGTE